MGHKARKVYPKIFCRACMRRETKPGRGWRCGNCRRWVCDHLANNLRGRRFSDECVYCNADALVNPQPD